MNSNFQVARILGIPIVINASWLITLAFVTSLLAIDVYPSIIPPDSAYRNDYWLHWVMAISSGLAFFLSVILHELAHSFVAQRQGIQVRNITLFIFGGVSQIAGESRKPLQEFVMAIVGPLTSALLGAIFLGLWFLAGANEDQPLTIVLEWLFAMNIVLAVFNMAPAFPMDGGRVLRSSLWGLTGNLLRSTRWATLISRGLGYGMMALGVVTFAGFIDFFDRLNGIWFIILGMFLESSAKQSWVQAKALDLLSQYRAEDIMTTDLLTARVEDEVRFLTMRGGRHFVFFVTDDDDQVVGVVTDKEVNAPGVDPRTPAGQVMLTTAAAPVAQAKEDAATVFQRMEQDSVWQLPVVSEGRVLGIVSREALIRLFTRQIPTQTGLAGRP
ncbi:MAG: M50 family metallopeptidase [Dehalococcoidia bacterium]